MQVKNRQVNTDRKTERDSDKTEQQVHLLLLLSIDPANHLS